MRHDLPAKMSEAGVVELEQNPPAWLAQSRANRSAKARPVWVTLTCDICGYTEQARPKKWWPAFTYVSCDTHDRDALPDVAPGFVRGDYPGVGTHFIGILDEAIEP